MFTTTFAALVFTASSTYLSHPARVYVGQPVGSNSLPGSYDTRISLRDRHLYTPLCPLPTYGGGCATGIKVSAVRPIQNRPHSARSQLEADLLKVEAHYQEQAKIKHAWDEEYYRSSPCTRLHMWLGSGGYYDGMIYKHNRAERALRNIHAAKGFDDAELQRFMDKQDLMLLKGVWGLPKDLKRGTTHGRVPAEVYIWLLSAQEDRTSASIEQTIHWQSRPAVRRRSKAGDCREHDMLC